jgi:ADP-heptose:LPS heptosyltransferase
MRAPFEDIDKHQVDRYLDVLVPLGISEARREPALQTQREDDEFVAKLLPAHRREQPLVGFFPGGSLAAKRWPLERFAQLSKALEEKANTRTIVFLGPEESAITERARSLFSSGASVLDTLTLSQLASAAARLDLLISNDTGPMHLAAAVGTPVLLLLGAPIREPYWFGPLGKQHRVFIRRSHAEITVTDVLKTARSMLKASDTSRLLALSDNARAAAH